MGIGVSGPGIADGLFIKTGDPSTVDEAAMFADGQLGKVIRVDHTTLYDPGAPRTFQYILRDTTDGATILTNGTVCYWVLPEAFTVTMDVSESLSGTADSVAGVFFAAYPTAAQYGFIQVAGNGPVRFVDSADTTVAAGLPVFGSTTDGKADNDADWAAMPYVPLGISRSALDAGSIGTYVGKVELCPPHNGW